MNKTFLLVASIFAFIGTVGLFFAGMVYVYLENILSVAGSELPQEELDMLMQIVSFARTLGVVLLIMALLNVVSGIRLLGARKGSVSSTEALVWGIYLIFGAGLLGGVFGILGATAKDQGGDSSHGESHSLENKLKDLDALYQKGVVSKEEYEERRSKILNHL